MVVEAANMCRSKVGATDADLQEVLAKNKPTTQTGKCLNKCLFETFGIVSEDFRYWEYQ